MSTSATKPATMGGDASAADLRFELKAAGFVPIPIDGKKPGISAWQTKTETSVEEIKSWSRWPSTGVLTRDAPALDIDILNQAAADAVEALARDHFEARGHIAVRIGQAPKRAIMFKTTTAFKKINKSLIAPDGSKQKLEFLGDGQQIVVAGIHPDTNKPYQWHGGRPGADFGRDDLPNIEEAEAQAFMTAAEALLCDKFGYRLAVVSQLSPAESPPNDNDSYWAALNSEALENLDAWVPALFPEAEKSNQGWRVSSKSLGRDLEEDLSLTPQGIKDFGVHDMGDARQGKRTPIDVVIEHGGKDFSAAVAWLRERLSAEQAASAGHAETGLGVWDAGRDIELPPPREWLLGNVFCRKFVSSLLGDGGVGKTALRIAQALSLATGLELTGEHVFLRCRVLILCLEDNADELRRRVFAARLHYNISAADLEGWLFLSAPGGEAGKLLSSEKGQLVSGKLAAKIEAEIAAHKIDLLIIDPFVKTHSVEENTNTAIDNVVQIIADLSAKYNIAIDTPHHTSKGTPEPGNADRGRGASAMKDGARLVDTMTPMNEIEAETFSIDPLIRKSFVRLDSAKVNIAPPMFEAKWFRLIGVLLGNSTALYPSGDNVQTVERWWPPQIWADLTDQLKDEIVEAIDNGLPDGSRYTDAPRADDRAAWKVVEKYVAGKSEAQAREIIKSWIKTGVLERCDYDNPVTRKPAKGLKKGSRKRNFGRIL